MKKGKIEMRTYQGCVSAFVIFFSMFLYIYAIKYILSMRLEQDFLLPHYYCCCCCSQC